MEEPLEYKDFSKDRYRRQLRPKHYAWLMVSGFLRFDFHYVRDVLDKLNGYADKETRHRLLAYKMLATQNPKGFDQECRAYNQAVDDYNREFEYIFGKE